MILRPARFEQFGHAWQTTRNVTRFGAFTRQARQHVAGGDRGVVFHRENRPRRQEVNRFRAVFALHHIVGLITQDQAGAKINGLAGRLVFHDFAE